MSSPLQVKLANNLKVGERRAASPLSTSSPLTSRTPLSGSPPLATRLSAIKRDNSISSSTFPNGVGLAPLDFSPQLQRSVLSVVKSRSGSVLSRGFILKTDHYPSGRALDLELNVHGAPNFRTPKLGNLNVFGVAQPRTQGLRAILSILRCSPGLADPYHCVWFSTREEPIVYVSGRSFVLRDASEPRTTLYMSDRAENLEDIERRLKEDILQEAAKFGGLILTHNEVATDHSGEGAILPTWTAVDKNNVKTSRELYEAMKKDGWRVDYYRIPISRERPIEDNYLDAYVGVIKETDPTKTSLVFSCGMGAVRTTYAMVAALLVRRRQVMALGYDDPFMAKGANTPSGFSTPTNAQVQLSLEQANDQRELSKSLLRLAVVLQQSIQFSATQSAVELLLSQPTLMDSLRKSLMGNYSVILSLLGCLDRGVSIKKLVDRVIDSCDHVVNLREDIFKHRVQYALTNMDQKRESYLDSAARGLEKYFFMIAFASYVEESSCTNFSESFSHWLTARTEIWNQVSYLRKSHGSRLNVFAPIQDLSAISKSGSEALTVTAGVKNDLEVAGEQVLGDEYTDHVIDTRSGVILREGTLLKSDQWHTESQEVSSQREIRGAMNFRNIPGSSIYALGQPSIGAIDEVVSIVRHKHPDADHIAWITLREEPVVYINGAPFCLRRANFSLRNMKDYGGISAKRLEILEERLKDDVIAELTKFGGKLLLHTETSDGSVVPVWEEVRAQEVEVLKDIMQQREDLGNNIMLYYRRIPITAEKPPDFADISDLMEVVTRTYSSNTPIVLNCQLGRGRSTMTSIIILLIHQWLQLGLRSRSRAPGSPGVLRRTNSMLDTTFGQSDKNRHSYQVINNLLRVIKNGLYVKDSVDAAIDQCSEVFNLRESIEEARISAEQATSDQQRKKHAQRGIHNLRRYFELIIFQWYLSNQQPGIIRDMEPFESFVRRHPVIKTFEKDLLAEGLSALKPLERVDLTESVALPDEARQVVMNRKGSILSASTILKSDFFSNLQKMSLPERIEGSPNFRRLPLTLRLSSMRSPNGTEYFTTNDGKMVCGSGMPTVQGLRRALTRVGADTEGKNKVFWTSLREEPVLYVVGRPHVLRLVDRPLENVEATGVTTQIVESMEISLKQDVIKELNEGDGQLLLHDEVEEQPGVFSIIPQWETVSEDDILTPRDVFELMTKEGFKVNYDRIAVTDEQAPLPDALFQLFERVGSGLKTGDVADFIFNCQMGRGRTTTGMVSACLVASIQKWDGRESLTATADEEDDIYGDSLDGPGEEEAYLQGDYKIILQLVGVLSHGKAAKILTDRAIDLMQDVQNLRKAVYDYKLKVESLTKGTEKYKKLMNIAINYLYRYGTLIVFANYLIERRVLILQNQSDSFPSFPDWFKEHREITTILGRATLS